MSKPAKCARWLAREDGARSMRGIDVQPMPALSANLADRLEIVERSRRSSSSSCDYSHYFLSLLAQRIENRNQPIDIHPEVVGGDWYPSLASHSELSNCASNC